MKVATPRRPALLSAAVTVRRPGQDGARDDHQQVGPGRAGEVAGKWRHPSGESAGVVRVDLACYGGLAVVSLPPDNSAHAGRINSAV